MVTSETILKLWEEWEPADAAKAARQAKKSTRSGRALPSTTFIPKSRMAAPNVSERSPTILGQTIITYLHFGRDKAHVFFCFFCFQSNLFMVYRDSEIFLCRGCSGLGGFGLAKFAAG